MEVDQAESPTMNQNRSAKRDADGEFKSDLSPSISYTTFIRRDNTMNEIIRLNVGGARYEVKRDTLMRYEGSMLASLVSGKWKEGEGEKEIFIEADGLRFKYILDYLRNDRACLPDLSNLSALKDDFDYFGIDADMSKISVVNDFTAIEELTLQISEHIAAIKHKSKRVDAIQESYRLAGSFSRSVGKSGGRVRIRFDEETDKELLRSCLQSRGLHVIRYETSFVTLCVPGMKHIYDSTS